MTEQQFRDVFYCTPSDVREISNIEKDVPEAKIIALQQHCEIFHINPILGVDLALSVKQELYDNIVSGSSISSGTTVLLEYIKYVEAHAVHYEIIPMLNFKTTRGGVMIMQPDNASGSDLEGITFLRKNVNELMSAYKGRLRDFLEENAAAFPEYETLNSDEFFSKNNSQGFLFY